MTGVVAATHDPAAVVADLEARARRIETPCGEGTAIWRVWGEDRADRAPLVLSHGAQGAWSHWIRNIDALSRERLVVAIDLPGHGDSALPETEDQAGIAAALARGLPLVVDEGRVVDLAGFSFGGVMFAWFAALYPELVRRLILIGCGGLDTPLGAVDLRRVSGLVGDERKAAIKANLLGLMLHHPDSADDLAQHLLITNARRARLVRSDLVLPDRLAHILPQVQAPVDAIWGALDGPHPVPHLQEAAIRRAHPNADFRVIADAGHWAMYERPEAFDATLLAMLAGPLRRPAP